MAEISVLIPVFNHIYGLERAVISVVNQSYAPSQVIIIDDGSDLEVSNKIREISEIYSVSLIRHDVNKGVSQARNTGIIASKYEWVALLDADDYWDDSFLECTIGVALDYSADLVGTAYRYLHANDIVSESVISRDKPLGCVFQVDDYFRYALADDLPFTCSSVLFSRKAAMKSSLFDVDLVMGEDQIFWYRLIQSGSRSFVINRLSSNYDLTGNHSACNSMSKAASWQFVTKIYDYSVSDKSSYRQRFIDKNALKAFLYSLLYQRFDLASEISSSNILVSRINLMLMNVLMFIPSRVAVAIVTHFYRWFGKR